LNRAVSGMESIAEISAGKAISKAIKPLALAV
jgi:hypothetical protein